MVIGGAERNAADFQIVASVRLLLAMGDLEPLLRRHQAAEWAYAMLPSNAFTVPAGFVPGEWLSRAGG